MKLCTRHKGDLKGALKRHNIAHLVDEAQLIPRTVRWLAGMSMEFDPLVICLCEIRQRAATYLPASVQLQKQCPICAANHHLKNQEGDKWIEGFAFACKTTAIQLLGQKLR